MLERGVAKHQDPFSMLRYFASVNVFGYRHLALTHVSQYGKYLDRYRAAASLQEVYSLTFGASTAFQYNNYPGMVFLDFVHVFTPWIREQSVSNVSGVSLGGNPGDDLFD